MAVGCKVGARRARYRIGLQLACLAATTVVDHEADDARAAGVRPGGQDRISRTTRAAAVDNGELNAIDFGRPGALGQGKAGDRNGRMGSSCRGVCGNLALGGGNAVLNYTTRKVGKTGHLQPGDLHSNRSLGRRQRRHCRRQILCHWHVDFTHRSIAKSRSREGCHTRRPRRSTA